MADRDPVETELKFLIEPGALGALRAHPLFRGPRWEEQLRSVYFDTAQGELRATGFSLRVREVGGAFVQTVKQLGAAVGFVRGEWECRVPSARPDLLALARTPAVNGLGGEVVLRRVFTTTVRRTSWLWRDGSGIVEVSLDLGEIRAQNRRARICEVELELKSGAPGVLFGLARDLNGEAPMRLSFDSKAERGFRLAGEEAPEAVGASRSEVTGEMSVAEAFRRIARACLTQTIANAEILRRARRPEALHQMRVGLRRFRAALSAFEPMLADPGLEVVKADTKWLAGELDGARDRDVFIKSTFRAAADQVEDKAGFAAFGGRLIEVQSSAYDGAMAAITSPRASSLLLEACCWVEVGGWTSGADPVLAEIRERRVESFAADALDHLLETVRRRSRGLEHLDATSRHKLRIKAKKLRYAAEFLAPAYGRHRQKEARKFLTRLEAMQDALGELNDIAVARRKAPEDAGEDAEMAFAAGRAVGWRERGERALIKTAAVAAKELRDAKRFWRP